MFPTKRAINARLKALENATEAVGDRIEYVPAYMVFDDEPKLTLQLTWRGFVVEREPVSTGPGKPTVHLHPTPPLSEVYHKVLWHIDGPTAARADIQIVWNADQRAEVVATATHEVVYETPELPADPMVLAADEGWEAVAPADRIVTNMILRQSEAEEYGYEVLGPVPPWIDGTDEYDLVEVDAEPVPYAERRPS